MDEGKGFQVLRQGRVPVRLRLYPEDPEPNPGPGWEPVVWDNKYPLVGAESGDIYINRRRDPPLYYVFNSRSNCELVPVEVIQEWVTGGTMMSPTQVRQSPDAREIRRPSLKPTEPSEKSFGKMFFPESMPW